jgi:acyl carrier protein
MSNDEIRDKIRTFLVENFLVLGDAAELDDGESLLEMGIIDSTGVLELVGFIEQTFGIQIQDQEVVPENLDTVDNVVAYVAGKLAIASAKSA